MKLFEKIKESNYRELRIFNLPVLLLKKHGKNYTIIPFKTLARIFYDKILSLTKNKYKYIIIYRSATGDITFLRMALNAFKEKYGINEKILIVSKRKVYKEIFDLYGFDADFLCIDFSFKFSNYLKNKFYKNTYFYVFHDYKFLSSLYNKKKIDTITNEWCKFHRIEKSKLENIKARFNIDKNDLENKLKDINLDFSNFVFLAFDDGSLQPLQETFIEKLYNSFTKKGYDVYFNSKQTRYRKSKLLNYNDTLALASLAKCIVTLRSGLSDILASTNTKQFLLYNQSKTRNLSSTRVQEIWTFADLINTKNTNFIEYDLAKTDEDSIIKNIMENI